MVSELIVKKNQLEIGVSIGLVAMMIVLILIVSIVVPEGLKPAGYSLVVLLFMVLMGFAGVKLIDIQ